MEQFSTIGAKVDIINQWELEVKTGNLLVFEARENASDQVVIGFIIAFDWLRGWREFQRVNRKSFDCLRNSPCQYKSQCIQGRLWRM